MKPVHVQARIDKRGAVRCQPSCPGWLASTSRVGRPRLVACVVCNDLHPARLQITDTMVKLLPLARERLAVVTRGITRERRERAITRHAPIDNNATSGALCGHSIGRTKSGRRSHVVTFLTVGANCAECLRLAAMTLTERDTERRTRSETLAVKFKAKRDEAASERARQSAITTNLVAEARVDARVALDILETVNFDHEQLAQMVNEGLEGAATRLELVLKTIAMAVTAYRHVNRTSRGERRWVFRSGYSDAGARRGVSDVRCRFCDVVLLAGGVIGTDYTAATDDHTVRCALEYLAGKLPEPPREEEEEGL